MESMVDLFKGAAFPVRNLVEMASSDLSKNVTKFEAKPYAPPVEHLKMVISSVPKVLITMLAWHLMFPLEQAKTLQWGWILHIVIRDLIITYLAAGPWDFLLYSDLSPVKKNLAHRKFNVKYPEWSMIRFCMFWSTVSTLISSAMEVAYLYALTNGYLGAWDHNIFSAGTLLWIACMGYWRLGHFFCVHRFMHPWKTTRIPDLGAFLYKHVHSLHHKSYNPTAWSGVAMHPVESFLYYSVMAVPAAFGAHPFVVILGKLDATVGALWGHDGHGDPGSGTYTHYLHHAHFEVNYGENLVPLDWWFGTYHAGGPLKKKST